MTKFDGRGRPLSERIIEISDIISRNTKLLQDPGFVPDEAFVKEQHRLLEECKRLNKLLSDQRAGRRNGDGIFSEL